MNKRFPHGIDITAPGGLTALMDFHRLTFGDAVMRINPDAGNGGGAGDGGTGEGGEGQPVGTQAQQGDGPADGDQPLGEGGLKALQAERDARAKAEKDLADAKAALQKIEDAKLSDIQRAQKERDDAAAELAAAKSDNARLAALATHPVPKEYQDLVVGTDEASYLASAKKVAELYAKAEGKPFRPAPDPSQGARQTAKTGGWDAGKAEAQKRFAKK
ncbi:scaffolding protein [Arthrobacter phage Seahorse]|uniref:Scaffolding protein n=1 Tax=Arthrobacter phage Seahorse TaxID=2419611 RepID=A0A3G3M6B3_9CAUD|nr:scaffolding protein [Arthrobacter phage Seahorse]AYR01508.1 scaffolding protein [Arthrobacter phage Seahorse]